MYVITGVEKGPNAAEARAQIIHVLRSIRWDPPLMRLPTDTASKAAMTMRVLTHLGADYACFPKVPRHSASRVVSRFAGQSPTFTPLRVTCTTTITAMSIGVWRLDLVARWVKSTTHPAGSTAIQIYVAPSGTTLVMTQQGGLPWK